jgi:hypothetical protein
MSPRYTSPESQAKAEAAWLAALRLQQFVYANISYEVSTTVAHATHIVKGWEAAGKVRRIATPQYGRASKITFEVIPEGEIRVLPAPGDAYDQMWTSMRKIGGFSPVDLASMCSVPVTVEEAAAYCRMLLTAGYLKVVQKAAPPNRPAIYRLINATGVRAPRVRRVACIVDPNRGTTLPLSEAQL